MRKGYCRHCGNLLDDETPIPERCSACLKSREREDRYNPVTGERLAPAVKHDDRMVIRHGASEFLMRTNQGNFVLTPADALALLEELELQRETLERLASEPEGQER